MRPRDIATGRDGRNSSVYTSSVLAAALVLLTGAGLLILLVIEEFGQDVGGGEAPAGQDVEDPYSATRHPTTHEGYTYSSSNLRPTADAAQSKLWFADGTWWGLLVNPGDDLVHVYELTKTHLWRDTGTVVDTSVGSRGDALWDEKTQQLVVASTVRDGPVRVARLGYDSEDRSWQHADGPPQEVGSQAGRPESVSVDRDSTGRLWLTHTQAGTVLVVRSDPRGLSWTAPFSPGGAGTDIGQDDISTLVALDADGSGDGKDSIGVVWSDQESDAFRFAIHRDGSADSSWRVETALSGPDVADDQLNVKTVRGRNGDLVVVAVKTSNDVADGLDATLVGLLARTPPRDAGGAGQGSLVPAGTVAEDHSRPVVLVDAENRELLFLSTSRPAGGDVYLKRTPPSKLHFPYGRGVPFLAHDTPVQDVTGTKQRLSRRSGVLALASSHGQHRYVYAESALKPTGVGP